MKSFKGKTNFYFSILQDQDINLLNLLDISKYYRLLGLTRVIMVLLLYKRKSTRA